MLDFLGTVATAALIVFVISALLVFTEVPRGAKFMDLKKKYMADEIEKLKKHVSEKDKQK